ncbi:MAG: glycogen synthase GlgA [Betaproteobacteria bacterium]|nr:glycogen synthase GlgA [Betaproteobacteria bacterium]
MSKQRATRVLFVTPEIAPWAKSGGLGDVSAALPATLRAIGVDVRVLVPAYPSLAAAFKDVKAATDGFHPGGAFAPARLLAASVDAVPAFFVDCPDYYHRPGGAYQDAGGNDWQDNHLRFGLLSRVAALLGSRDSPLAWKPDVVHCHDWPCGLAPAYLDFLAGPRSATLMTIHNIAFQGVFPATTLPELGLPAESFAIDGVEYYGNLSFLKAGIHFAERISTVSPTYAREIQTDELGCGLGGLLRHRSARLTGILNGIDSAVWNPATDPLIAQCFEFARIERKTANKRALQVRFDLGPRKDVPLLGIVSRLTHQKGLDLLAAIVPRIATHPAQLVVLGTGEPELEAAFRALAARFPGRVAAVIGYDEALAHLIEAGADIFVMPSRFEPCGLNQMYSMRYGTPPVVRATGGLADTVVDCTPDTRRRQTATGFVFNELTADALLEAIGRALAAWNDKRLWRALQRNGMRRDFGWQTAARKYSLLYRSMINFP